MKPCAFEYFNPQSVQETIELLNRYGDEAKIIAGGQSLVPMMNFRLARPEILIDINAIKELEYIKTEGDELVIGALTRERDIEQSPLVLEKWPFLSKAISFIGHSAIRNRGTIGGSLVHADPSAEIPTSLCALNGKVKIVGPSGEKILEPEEFFLTYLTTSLEPSDFLVEVRIPALPEKTGWSFR
jgi:2-furoyl-CoA dehydrogenase FAD binding subunit